MSLERCDLGLSRPSKSPWLVLVFQLRTTYKTRKKPAWTWSVRTF